MVALNQCHILHLASLPNVCPTERPTVRRETPPEIPRLIELFEMMYDILFSGNNYA